MFELVATMVVLGIAGAGIGFRSWYNRHTLKKAGTGLTTFAQKLPPIAGCWLQILGEVHAILLREGLSYLEGRAYQDVLATLSQELPHWESVEEAFQRYAGNPEMQNGNFGKPFPKMAWEALSSFCIERQIGGPFVARYAMHAVVEHPDWPCSAARFFLHPGSLMVFSSWLIGTVDEYYQWPNGKRISRTEVLERITGTEQLTIAEKVTLLNSIRLSHSGMYPDLVSPDEGEHTIERQLLNAFIRVHPWLMGQVFGSNYAQVFGSILRLPPADPTAVREYACVLDGVRPSVCNGYLICPVCQLPENLSAGILRIIGLFGTIPSSHKEPAVLYKVMEMPIEPQMLADLDEIMIGSGTGSEKFTDQLMVHLEHIQRIHIRVHPASGITNATARMIEEYNNREGR